MTLTCSRITSGRASTAWLRERVRALQGGDPLTPVTVVAPTHHSGLDLRHGLAASGYASVRFTVLARLAEMLGAADLGGDGRTPLTAAVRGALVRVALRGSGGPLRASAEHAGLGDLIGALDRELRHRFTDAREVTALRAGAGPTTRAALDAIDAYRSLLAQHARYDDVDLLRAASAAVRAGRVDSILRDLGTIVVHLAVVVDAPIADLLTALAERVDVEVSIPDLGDDTPPTAWAAGVGAVAAVPRPADGDTAAATRTVVIAPDAVEEVRSAVREAIAAMERDPPVPLHRQAIVYRDADVYGPVLRDTIAAAGLPFASLDGRPLADTVPARALLNLLRLRKADFSRAAVLGWLSGLPGSSGVLRNQARWDKLSRDAGVIRGVAQWGDRLEALAGETARRRDEWLRDDADESSGRIRAMERDIEECRAIAEHIRALAELTTPPAERTWPAHVAWIHRLRDEVLTPDRAWSDADRESSQRVGEIIDALGAAADVEPDVDVSVVLRALEDALRAQRRPEGRFGGGIVIGPHDALSGIDLDRVHILGVVEGTFPAAMRPDPLLPGDPLDLRSEHEAGDRRAWRMALEAAGGGGETVVSAPMVDVEGRAVFPSPWLLRVLDEDGRRPAATEVRSGRAAHERLRHTGSELAATYRQPPLSLAERREREALQAYLARIDVARIGLARRDDLPLGRALELTRARGSAGLTDFDGNLISIAPTSALLQPGLEARTQSATGVEQWATCPFRFLLGRILWVSATDDADDERWWQIDAAEKGTLIHRILERFFAGVIADGEPPPGAPYTPAQQGRLRTIALEEFAAAETRGVTGHPLVWANERNTILSDLRFLLDVDTERRAAGGWTPAHVEQSFGGERDGSWPAVEVPIGQGRAIRFRGYIDRVDRAPGLARVIDYKSGSTKASTFSVANRLDAGRRLQLAVYAEAVRQQARHAGATPPATIAQYWYATAKANFDVREITVTPEVERVLAEVITTIDAGVRGGCFPQVPGDWNDHAARCDNCRYCDYDTVCPAGREVLAATKRESSGTLLHRELTSDDAGTDTGAEEGDE